MVANDGSDGGLVQAELEGDGGNACPSGLERENLGFERRNALTPGTRCDRWGSRFNQ